MPRLEPIGVVIQSDEALNDTADHEGDRSQKDLPTYRAKPAGRVAQNLLVLRRSKFGNPMVLSSRGRAPIEKG